MSNEPADQPLTSTSESYGGTQYSPNTLYPSYNNSCYYPYSYNYYYAPRYLVVTSRDRSFKIDTMTGEMWEIRGLVAYKIKDEKDCK